MATDSPLFLMIVLFGFLPLSVLAVAYLRDIRAILREAHGPSSANSTRDVRGAEGDGV